MSFLQRPRYLRALNRDHGLLRGHDLRHGRRGHHRELLRFRQNLGCDSCLRLGKNLLH